MENTLLRVAGALFCHDAKRAPTRTDEIELNRGVKEKTIVVRPDPRFGAAGTARAQNLCCDFEKAFQLRPPDPQ
jgi:hypothetical protein